MTVSELVDRARCSQEAEGLPVGIDIDGVIADIAGQLVRYARELWGCSIDLRDLTSENIETCTELSATQALQIFSTPSFFRTMSVLPQARESLNELKQIGFEVVLVTDRFWYPSIQTDTLSWLRCNKIPFHSIRFSPKSEKGTLSHELGIKFFVEDQLSNANLLSEVCSEVFLVDRPYNQGSALPCVSRVKSLEQAVRRLRDLKGQDSHLQRTAAKPPL